LLSLINQAGFESQQFEHRYYDTLKVEKDGEENFDGF
jgi:hypothetical protein